jgi:hypothetical protein
MNPSFLKVKLHPLQRDFSLHMSTSMSWLICGSEIWLPWNGGTTFGLTNHLQPLWVT